MIDRSQLQAELRTLRQKEGLGLKQRLRAAPGLMAALNATTAEEADQRLRSAIDSLGQSRNIRAMANALAIGYLDPETLTVRRQWFSEAEGKFDMSTVIAWENRGIDTLINHLEFSGTTSGDFSTDAKKKMLLAITLMANHVEDDFRCSAVEDGLDSDMREDFLQPLPIDRPRRDYKHPPQPFPSEELMSALGPQMLLKLQEDIVSSGLYWSEQHADIAASHVESFMNHIVGATRAIWWYAREMQLKLDANSTVSLLDYTAQVMARDFNVPARSDLRIPLKSLDDNAGAVITSPPDLPDLMQSIDDVTTAAHADLARLTAPGGKPVGKSVSRPDTNIGEGTVG